MLTDNLHITFSMVWMIVIANIVASVLLMFLAKQVAKIAFVPGHLIVPGVILFVFMGAWLGGASMGDWITCLLMGFVGFIMKRGGWPRPPLILALILGNILENTFQISNRAYDGLSWMTRPIVLAIFVLIVLTLIFAVKNTLKKKSTQADESDSPATGEGSDRNPLISLPFSLILAVAFIWAGFTSLDWPAEVKQFPVAISIPASILVMIALFYDYRDLIAARSKSTSWRQVVHDSAQSAELVSSLSFYAYLTAMIVLAYIFGQKIALPLFIGIYLWRWGHYNWRIASSYAIGGWVFIVGFYDQIMHLLFHPSWLNSWLRPLFPEWLPTWLLL